MSKPHIVELVPISPAQVKKPVPTDRLPYTSHRRHTVERPWHRTQRARKCATTIPQQMVGSAARHWPRPVIPSAGRECLYQGLCEATKASSIAFAGDWHMTHPRHVAAFVHLLSSSIRFWAPRTPGKARVGVESGVSAPPTGKLDVSTILLGARNMMPN
jgi:hypothetical protein